MHGSILTIRDRPPLVVPSTRWPPITAADPAIRTSARSRSTCSHRRLSNSPRLALERAEGGLPVSPRPVLPCLIHQAFADIEDNSTDHAATLRQLLGQDDAMTIEQASDALPNCAVLRSRRRQMAPLAQRQRPGLCLGRPARAARRAIHHRTRRIGWLHRHWWDAGLRLPRSRLSGSRPPHLGRPFGPSHAIGYADPRPGSRSPGDWRLRGIRGGCREGLAGRPRTKDTDAGDQFPQKHQSTGRL